MRSAFSAEDLAETLRAEGVRVGTATVYRAVAAMEASGFIEPVGVRDGAAVYTRCRGEGHHHHLVCESCGRVEEAPCDLADAVAKAALGTGFVVTRHEFTLHGLCPACARRGGR
jgi:Fur family ferric uptake transcriptional regulator